MQTSSTSYDNVTGEDIYWIVRESPISFFLTYIVPKSSPFIRPLNRAISDWKEYGFGKYVQLQISAEIEHQQAKRLIRKQSRETQAISLCHLTNVFTFYIFCVIICCTTFLLELYAAKISKLLEKFCK